MLTDTAVFAYDDETVIGCGGICYQTEMPSPDNPNGKCGYLMNIYTLPEYRGMGVGNSIVEYLINDARARCANKIYLESSEKAKKLYYEKGFRDMVDYMKLQIERT